MKKITLNKIKISMLIKKIIKQPQYILPYLGLSNNIKKATRVP
jgi:hypothetical protein